jgi:hypothetical protein
MYTGKRPEDLVEHEAVGTQVTGENVSRTWRVERYLELGFSTVDAEMLADVRDVAIVPDRKGTPRRWSYPLHWGRVAKVLEAGATHAQAVAVFG